MYAVMGITGQVGGAVARALLASDHGVRGVVRDPSKAAEWTPRGVVLSKADQSDAAALTAALTGVDGAFVMLPPMFAPTADFAEARQLTAALHAALSAAAVPRVIALSTIGAEHEAGTGILKGLHLMEQGLSTLPVPVAFVRAAWFMQNFTWDVQAAHDRGELASLLQPLDRPVPMVSTEDVGRVAAEVLAGPAWSGRRVIEVESPRRYTPEDVAAALSAVVRRVVRPRAVPRDQWVATFELAGAPPEAAALRAEMIDGFNSGHVDFPGGTPGAELMPGRVTLDEALAGLIAG